MAMRKMKARRSNRALVAPAPALILTLIYKVDYDSIEDLIERYEEAQVRQVLNGELDLYNQEKKLWLTNQGLDPKIADSTRKFCTVFLDHRASGATVRERLMEYASNEFNSARIGSQQLDDCHFLNYTHLEAAMPGVANPVKQIAFLAEPKVKDYLKSQEARQDEDARKNLERATGNILRQLRAEGYTITKPSPEKAAAIAAAKLAKPSATVSRKGTGKGEAKRRVTEFGGD